MDLEQLKIDVDFMVQALKEAQKAADRDEIPVGCVIVADNGNLCGGRGAKGSVAGNRTGSQSIVARAHNLTELLKDPTAHAEMQAVTAATAHLGGKYLDKCTIYVTVEPCPMCAAALNWAQIRRVVYGCGDPKRGSSLFAPSLYHPKTEVTGGVLEKECAAMISGFLRKKRKK